MKTLIGLSLNSTVSNYEDRFSIFLRPDVQLVLLFELTFSAAIFGAMAVSYTCRLMAPVRIAETIFETFAWPDIEYIDLRKTSRENRRENKLPNFGNIYWTDAKCQDIRTSRNTFRFHQPTPAIVLRPNNKIMINFIRLGDDTDHGGKVIAASSTMRFDSLFVARKGDAVLCPQHPSVQPNVIEEGDESITDGGLPLARHGHRATCGCHLISSLV